MNLQLSKSRLQKILEDLVLGNTDHRTTWELEKAASDFQKVTNELNSFISQRRQRES